jgi:hypothetical protein
MPTYFPRHAVEWRLEEPPAFRRLTLSLVEMALITGVLLRLVRAFTSGHARESLLFFIAAVLIWAVLLIGMATAHLANYPLGRWFWRAPLFGLVVTVGEMATSLLLIALHREPNGTGRAGFGDWPSLAARALLHSELTLCLWMLLLAGVIILVRRAGMARGVEGDPLSAELPVDADRR